jgi:hypothetical protein
MRHGEVADIDSNSKALLKLKEPENLLPAFMGGVFIDVEVIASVAVVVVPPLLLDELDTELVLVVLPEAGITVGGLNKRT